MAILGDDVLGGSVLGWRPRPLKPAWLSAPQATVTIAGIVQEQILEWHTDLTRDQLATADLTLPYPAGIEVVEGAEVQIAAAADDDEAQARLFRGTITAITPESSDDGKLTQLQCTGSAWPLSLSLERELAFAGGAPIDARLLSSQVIHVGNQTVAWYADPSPDGLSVDLAFSPKADARFVRVTGRQHGANSFREEPERDIRDFSRIEIRQQGRLRGYANLPASDEDWSNRIDYTDDANWEDVDLTIGAAIDADAGDVTVRFTSGRKPGSKERDDYEVKGVTYQMAGRVSARDLFRSVLRDRGFGPAGNGVPYQVAHIVDLRGNEIQLGGNGLVANGRIVLADGSQPWSWLTESANLWGYAVVDGPDSLAIVALRGDPAGRTIDATFEAGVNVFAIRPSRDAGVVTTLWRVYGASGSDEQGEPFQYQSLSDPAAIAQPAFLPNPPGLIAGEIRNELLVSDGLARAVRQIAEVEHEAIPLTFELDVVPSPGLIPGMVAHFTSVDDDVDRAFWITSVTHDWSEGGFWTTLGLQVATGQPNPEADAAVEPRIPPSKGTRHIGVRAIVWYRRSDSDGSSVRLPFHPGGAYRGVRVTGRCHGTNSWPATPPPAELLPSSLRGIARSWVVTAYDSGNWRNSQLDRFGKETANAIGAYLQAVENDDDDQAELLDAVPSNLPAFIAAVGELIDGSGTHGAINRFVFSTGDRLDVPSAVEVWQFGTRIGSAPLPVHPERFSERRDYGSNDEWSAFDVMVSAEIQNASAELRFISGTSLDGTQDEYEIKRVEIALYAEATEQGPVPQSGADWHAYESKRVWRWSA